MRASAQKAGSLVFEGIDEDSNDYRLEGCSAWVSVGELNIYIHRTSDGVAVDIFARRNEADDPAVASCEVGFTAEDITNVPTAMDPSC